MNEDSSRNASNFSNWMMGICGVLVVSGILGGLAAWHSASQRLAVIEFQLQQQSTKAELDAEQSRQISILWQAAAQNKDAINNRHRTDNLPLHKWDFKDTIPE